MRIKEGVKNKYAEIWTVIDRDNFLDKTFVRVYDNKSDAIADMERVLQNYKKETEKRKYLEIIKESKLEYTLYNRKLDTIANNVLISHQNCKITDYK